MKRKAREMQPFRMGVNYWPRSSATRMWQRFDRGEIAEDFARLHGLGLGVVRFALEWEAFQPEPFATDTEMLRRFDTVLDCARGAGLETIPTLFSGFALGLRRLPEWTLDRRVAAGPLRTLVAGKESPYGAGDLYTGELLEAQRWFARRLGLRARDDETVLAWDLGRAFSVVCEPRAERDAAHWSAALTHDLYDASNRPATAGVGGEDLTQDRNVRLSSVAEPWEFVSLDGHSMPSPFESDPPDPGLPQRVAALAGAFSQRPVFATDVGRAFAFGSEAPDGGDETTAGGEAAGARDAATAAYATAAIERLHAGGAFGVLWTQWADYADGVAAEPPFDRTPRATRGGIVRADGSEKPVARSFADIASEGRAMLGSAAHRHPDEHSYYRDLPNAALEAFASDKRPST